MDVPRKPGMDWNFNAATHVDESKADRRQRGHEADGAGPVAMESVALNLNGPGEGLGGNDRHSDSDWAKQARIVPII